MDNEGFRALLKGRPLSEEQIENMIALAERFEIFIEENDRNSSTENVQAFSEMLIQEKLNTFENYSALARYGQLLKDNEIFLAVIELLEGTVAHPNLYQKIGEAFGRDVLDEVFAGIGVVPIGATPPDKPHRMHTVIRRLKGRVGEEACKTLLSDSLENLRDEYYSNDKKMYQESQNVDEYLAKKKQAFVGQLEECMQEGRLFYAQEITEEVIEYVRRSPEIGGGRREGNIIYETKIPYLAKQFLAESDPTLKRYYYCHCPWVRTAVKNGDVELEEIFCYCSGGYHKKPWEVILGQPLKVELLETVLRGDARCRFAIHLPELAVIQERPCVPK